MATRSLKSAAGTADIRVHFPEAVDIGHDTNDHKIKYIDDTDTLRILITEGLAPLGFIIENPQDSLTAHAGGGQAAALQLTGQMVMIGTVANPADSVKLPASQGGLEITIINAGANALQVFGLGSDTIDGAAASVGVSQLPNSAVLYFTTAAGAWRSEGLATGYDLGGRQTLSFLTGVTAFAGGGQASAVLLSAMINRVSTVANPGDSVKLPPASSYAALGVGASLSIVVQNAGANDMQVFGSGTDTVDGVATATGVAHPSGATVTYTVNANGNWTTSISAQQAAYGLNRITNGETLVADSNATVTAAQLLKGFLRSIPTAARTWTLDTAANLDAAIPAVKVGHSFTVYVNNNSAGAFSISFTAGLGMTFFPSAGVTVAQNKSATLVFFRTAAAAWSVYHQVSA